MIPVHVSGGELSDKERKAYIDRAIEKYPDKQLSSIDITVDGDYVDLIIVLSRFHLNGSDGSLVIWLVPWINGTTLRKQKSMTV